MTKCAPKQRCVYPRSLFWKTSLGINWFENPNNDMVLEKKVIITDAQIKSAHTTEVILIDSSGANKIIMPMHISSVNRANTSAYNSVPMRFSYTGLTPGQAIDLYASAGALSLTASAFGDPNNSTLAPDYTLMTDKAFVLKADSAITGSSFDVLVSIYYYIWDIS